MRKWRWLLRFETFSAAIIFGLRYAISANVCRRRKPSDRSRPGDASAKLQAGHGGDKQISSGKYRPMHVIHQGSKMEVWNNTEGLPRALVDDSTPSLYPMGSQAKTSGAWVRLYTLQHMASLSKANACTMSICLRINSWIACVHPEKPPQNSSPTINGLVSSKASTGATGMMAAPAQHKSAVFVLKSNLASKMRQSSNSDILYFHWWSVMRSSIEVTWFSFSHRHEIRDWPWKCCCIWNPPSSFTSHWTLTLVGERLTTVRFTTLIAHSDLQGHPYVWRHDLRRRPNTLAATSPVKCSMAPLVPAPLLVVQPSPRGGLEARGLSMDNLWLIYG